MHLSLWFLALSSYSAPVFTTAQVLPGGTASRSPVAAQSSLHSCHNHQIPNLQQRALDNLRKASCSQESRPHDPYYLPSGTYDAFERPISEEEYNKQVEYQQRTGLPYYRDREDEQKRKNYPLSVKFFKGDYSQDEQTGHLTEVSVCVGVKGSKRIQVESISSLCNIFTFTDENCEEGSFDAIPGLEVASGHFHPGEFSSSRVECGDELPA
jgi:hypothetical protein